MLTLRLLGPMEVRLGERTVDGAGRDKGVLLLAYLAATAGRTHARENLADLFWPEMTRERALHNLRQTLLRLRGLLPGAGRAPSYLITETRAVAFNRDADYWLDVEPFSAPFDEAAPGVLERRVALYRGRFMEDCDGDIGERFAEWVEEQRGACHRVALTLEESLAAQHERGGRIQQAVAHARRCVCLEPWLEAGHRRLMRLLALAGQADAAMRHLQALREELRRELGHEPEAETLQLGERIRCGEFEPAPAPAAAPAERREVTVLDFGLACGDIDDPETLAEALAEPGKLARVIIEAAGGHITEHHPTRVSACFGWPAADERAGRHAAGAALALRRGMMRKHPDVTLAVGIDSGRALNRPGDNGAWHIAEQALRLRLAAPAGSIFIGAALRERLHGFETIPLPPAKVKARAWRLAGELERPAAARGAAPLLGRSAELASLRRAWRGPRAGSARALALSGEAGIGKTRLVREFLNHVTASRGRMLWCECEPSSTDSLLPLVRTARAALGLNAGAEAGQDRLAACLAASGFGDPPAARTLAPLFCPEQVMPAQEQEPAITDALCDLLAHLIGPSAVLVVEDVHWASATTLETLDALMRRHAGVDLLVVLTARRLPLLPPALAQCAQLVELRPLTGEVSTRLAAALADDAAAVARAADGNPLFVVELARMLASARRGETIPGSLRDLLTARLDQAGGDKGLLQAAAVMGRSFSLVRLRRLTHQEGRSLEPLSLPLGRLVESGLLEHDPAGEEHFRFSHALLQRAAYESLPRARRAELHRHAADVLQHDVSGASAPETIAWHLAEGGLPGEAAEWWLRAAQRASHIAAYTETSHLAGHALAALTRVQVASRDARWDLELKALLLAAYARVALGGYFDEQAQTLYARAAGLIRDHDADPRQTLGFLRGHWFGASSRASYREARAIAGEMIAIADAAGLDAFRGIARYLDGNAALWLGEFEAASNRLAQAVDILAGAAADPGATIAHDQDFETTAVGYLGWAHWYLGRADSALALGRRAVDQARSRGHVLTLLHAATTLCSIGMGSHCVEEVQQVAQEMIRVALPRELSMWADVGRLLQHWSQAQLGGETDTPAAVAALGRLCAAYPGGAAGFQAIFADACLALGELEHARETLAAFRLSLQATEAGAFAVTCHMLHGELARQEQRPRAATAAFRRAIESAAAQGSPMLEAQAWAALCEVSPTRANRAGSAAASARCTGPTGRPRRR